jgi:hypothetical protein
VLTKHYTKVYAQVMIGAKLKERQFVVDKGFGAMSKRGLRRGALAPSFSSGPVHFRVIQDRGPQTIAELGVDYSKAEIPDRSYYADYVDVERARSGISILFGKLIPGTARLRTQVEIVFPDDMFLKQLWGTSRDLHKTLADIQGRLRMEPIGRAEETDKVQTFRANNVFMGTWGDEAVTDFYYLSPRDFFYVKAGSKSNVDLEPVLRVVMYPGLLLEFLDNAKKLIPALESSSAEVIGHE